MQAMLRCMDIANDGLKLPGTDSVKSNVFYTGRILAENMYSQNPKYIKITYKKGILRKKLNKK